MVGDTLFAIGEQPRPMMYFPIDSSISQGPKDFEEYGALAIRSGQDVTQFALPVQKIVQSLDRDLAVSDILTMDQGCESTQQNLRSAERAQRISLPPVLTPSKGASRERCESRTLRGG